MEAPVKKNGMAVAGFVLGLISLVFCWVPVLNWICGLLAFIFSLIGVIGKKPKKGFAIAGLILSCIVWVVAFLVVGAVAAGAAASL